jgi:O-antigen/teichoic acid export membrane protein
MGLSFFISIYVIRYLGPENVGLLEYSYTLTQLLTPILGMGLSGILVRELVKKNNSNAELISSSFCLKLLLSIILYLGLMLYVLIFVPNSQEKIIILILGINLFLNSFLVLEHYFTSQILGKKIAISKVIAFSFSSIIKLLLVYLEKELIFFVIIMVVETTLYSILLVIFYFNKKPIFEKPKSSQMISFVKNGWPFILSDYSMFLLKKIDILMVKYFIGFVAVGYYSIAVKISGLLAIIPMVILTSVFPYLVKSEEESGLERAMIKIYRLFLVGMVIICTSLTLYSNDIINILFGKEYSESIPILSIYAWSSVFMTIHMINNKFFIVKNLQKEFFYRSLGAGVLNILLSYIAIKEFGLVGAAIGTLISMIVLSYISLYFSSNGRKLLVIFHNSIGIKYEK